MNTSIIISIIKAFLLPIIAVVCVKKINLFKYMSFIPDNKLFDIGLTSYLAILELMYVKCSNWICLKYKASIQCIFYIDKNSKKICNTPTISFCAGVAYLHCCISVKGSPKILEDYSVIILFPDYVELQLTGSKGRVDQNKFVIDVSTLIFENGDIVDNTKVDLKIGIILNSSSDDYFNTIKASLEKNTPIFENIGMVDFESNKFELRTQ